MVISPYLTELPRQITIGSPEEILESSAYRQNLIDKYEEQMILPVGTRTFIVHGDIYIDMGSQKETLNLHGKHQLGMHGYISSFDSKGIPDISSNQSRYQHSLDAAIRMEITCRLNGLSEDVTRLAIGSGFWHDLYSPPLSDQGKLANREALDEEKNIEMILSNKALLECLARQEIGPEDLISTVRGEHPVLGKLMNSHELDVDKISYTLIDNGKIHPCVAGYDQRHLFEWYREDSFARDAHESACVDSNGDVCFLKPEAVKKLLYIRAWMYENVYFSPFTRAREAFLERELARMWKEGKLSLGNMMEMNDHEFDRYIRQNIRKKIGDVIFSLFPDFFCEQERIKDADLEEVRKIYSRRGRNFIVKKQRGFSPGTGTMLSTDGMKKPFREVFPEDAKILEEIAESCEYIGVYKADFERKPKSRPLRINLFPSPS